MAAAPGQGRETAKSAKRDEQEHQSKGGRGGRRAKDGMRQPHRVEKKKGGGREEGGTKGCRTGRGRFDRVTEVWRPHRGVRMARSRCGKES